MKKKILILITMLVCSKLTYAGLITHSDYNPGDTITASKQNTNENAIFNEFNGNIETTNIKANTIDITNMNSVFQTSFTNTQNLTHYRRPVLQWVSTGTVTVETGVNGTSGAATITFPDGNQRTDSTASRIVLNVAQVAALSGTAQSGLYAGSVSSGSWYAVYAVKTTDNSSNFVLVATGTLPVQSAYSNLNTIFGTNGWTYLGLIAYGNHSNVGNQILPFTQSGNTVYFSSITAIGQWGYVLASVSGASSLGWTYTSGVVPASGGVGVIPSNITLGIFQNQNSHVGSYNTQFFDRNANLEFMEINPANGKSVAIITAPVSLGHDIVTTDGGTPVLTVAIVGWIDNVLGVGSNPQL